MAFRLCLAGLGPEGRRWDVDGLMEEMPATMLDRWLVYAMVEPWGGYQEDLRAGMLAALFANWGREKGGPVRKPEDFFKSLKDDTPMTPEQLSRQMKLNALPIMGKR